MTSSIVQPTAVPLAVAAPKVEGSRRLLIATGLLLSTAAVRSLRLELGGLLVPLYVLPILIALPTVVVPGVQRFPKPIRVAMAVFFALFAFSVLRYGSSFGDVTKMATSGLTVIAIALMVGKREHFLAASLALAVSLLVINGIGFRGGFIDHVGYEPLRDIGNKNSYSIYALPIVLLAGFVLLHFRVGTTAKLVLGGSILSTVFLLFSGANRSGWGGIVLIAGILAIQARRWRALALVGGLGLVSYAAFSWFGTSSTFDYRLQQTTEGHASDEMRVSMFSTAWEIALDHPIFGTTPQELAFEMGRRIDADTPVLDTHNFMSYIAAGSGFPALLALAALGFALWKRPIGRLTPRIIAASDLVRLVVILFLFRGQFSREVFFVGPFPIALGLALGLLIASQADAQREEEQQLQPDMHGI